jgi:flagellar biosynthesis/type III secretory pathway M-ring protein FliF/YscJ
MNWILENLQVVVIVLIVVVTLVRKVFETLRTNKPAAGPTLEDMFGPDDELDEDDTRRGAAEPPPSLPRETMTREALRKVTLPADMGAHDTEVERQREMQERLRKIREAKTNKQPAAAAPMRVKPPAHTAGGLKSRLRSGKELRRAIVIREIIGPPLGLR